MKKSILLIGLIGLISLTGCKKEEQVANNQFTATIENPSKTYLNLSNDGTIQVTWKAGDEVSINGVKYTATNISSDGLTATLVGGEVTPNTSSGLFGYVPPYEAYYPYDGLNVVEVPAIPEINFPGGTIRTPFLPYTQTYYPNNEVHAPMYCQFDGPTFTMYNLCGILMLNLQATGKSIRSITVTADEDGYHNPRYLSGACTYAFGSPGDPYYLSMNDNQSKSVTLDCGTSGVSINSPANFFIYLPPADYATLVLTFTATDGTVCTKSFVPDANHERFTVQRAKYHPLTFSNLTFTTPSADSK